MKNKNILIHTGSTGDSNMALNYSKILKEKGHNIFFCTSNTASFSFLKAKGVEVYFLDVFNYSNNFNIEDLKKYEETYLLKNNITLEKVKFSDRNYFNKKQEDFYGISFKIIKELEKIIDDKNINLGISQISSSLTVRFSGFILRTKGYKHIYTDGFPLEKNRFIISDIDESLKSSTIDDLYYNNIEISDKNKKKIDDYIKSFVDKNKMIYKPVNPKLFSIKNFKSFFKLIKEIELKGNSSIFNRVSFQLKKIFSAKIGKLRIKYNPKVKNEKYIFFPIHVSEDAQILVRNDFYFNQIDLIENISRNLPIGYKLYIKEHPNNIGGLGIKNIKKIKKIENVSLINPFENSQNIIQDSKGVIIINGSAGLETLARKKPLVILGNVFYGKGENIKNIEGIKSIFNGINWINNFSFNKKDFYRLFDSILEGTYKGNFLNYYGEKSNFEQVGESINNYIQKKL